MLSRIVNYHFNKVIKCAKLVDNLKNDNNFHNSLRLKYIPKGQGTYCGDLCCGVTTFVLGNLLKKHMPIKMFITEKGYGKYKKDHVFLKTNDLIIDPTYRQFFNDDRNSAVSNYNSYLYNSLPPFFVGNQKELDLLINDLKFRNSLEFSINVVNDNVKTNWNTNKEITEKLNNYDKIYNKDKVLELFNKNDLILEYVI